MSMKIVVGVDGSEPSQRAVEWCATHAGALDAEVVVVHAIDMPFYPSPTGMDLPVPPLSPKDRVKLSEQITNVWCAPLATAKVPYRVVLRDGKPALVLIEEARTEHADLVVAARRGRGGFAELVLGSTTHTLIHHLDRPLLIVP